VPLPINSVPYSKRIEQIVKHVYTKNVSKMCIQPITYVDYRMIIQRVRKLTPFYLKSEESGYGESYIT